MSNSDYKNEFYRNTKPAIVAHAVNTDVVTNLNNSTSFTSRALNGNPIRVDSGFLLSGNGFQVVESGWVSVASHIYYNGAALMSIEAAVGVNGVPRAAVFGSSIGAGLTFGYVSVIDSFYANANDIIDIMTRRATGGGTGSAIMIAGGSYISIRKEAVVGVLAQPYKEVYLKTITQLQSTSNSVLTSVPELAVNVVAGNAYKIVWKLFYQSSASTNGIAFSLSSSATGLLAADYRDSTAAAAGTLGGFSSFGTVVVNSATPTANQPAMCEIECIFNCTQSGTITPQFRNEVNGQTLTLLANSIAEIRQL